MSPVEIIKTQQDWDRFVSEIMSAEPGICDDVAEPHGECGFCTNWRPVAPKEDG